MRATGLLAALVPWAAIVATAACGDGAGGGAAGSTGAGGSAGGAGAGGSASGGTTGVAGTGGAPPPCPSRAVLGNLCTVLDPQVCYTRCGPEGAGDRAATCDASGVYIDAPVCEFNWAFDWSPYKLPATGNAACGAGVMPRAFETCDVGFGIVCNSMQGLPGGTYLDAAGATTIGFCVCVPNTDFGDRKGWSCAPEADWPCPRGRGC